MPKILYESWTLSLSLSLVGLIANPLQMAFLCSFCFHFTLIIVIPFLSQTLSSLPFPFFLLIIGGLSLPPVKPRPPPIPKKRGLHTRVVGYPFRLEKSSLSLVWSSSSDDELLPSCVSCFYIIGSMDTIWLRRWNDRRKVRSLNY